MDTTNDDHDDPSHGGDGGSLSEESSVGGTEQQKQKNQKLEVAKRENQWVWRLRLLTTFVMGCVAIAVCFTAYYLSRSSEKSDFEHDFTDVGDKLVNSFEDVVTQRVGILESFAAELTAYANNTWPYVISPGFIQRAGMVSQLAHVVFIALCPRVEAEQLEEWNNYAMASQGKFPAKIFPMMLNAHWGGPPKPEDGPGPYYPIWESFPATNISMANVNIYNDIEHVPPMDVAYETGKPAFETSKDYIRFEKDDRYGMFEERPDLNYQDDPFTVAWIPIFNKLEEPRKVANLMLVWVYWRTYFDSLLPPGAEGVIVILENDCDQQYTYQVDGEVAKFVDFGDLHDTKYDYLGTSTNLSSILDLDLESKITDETIEHPECHYSIRVYPSEEFENLYYTNKPWINAIVLGCLFLLTSSVFLMYDCMVERRQNAVMKSAQQSGKLVQSLFPDDVRKRLYAEQEANEQEQAKKNTWETSIGGPPNEIETKAAIANLYPDTTIFFADLAGFTKWSSTRTPIQVFELLETLYGAFDAIASKRSVFKVETIGDCYVSVTGLPEPQEDHAERMVKFADNCMAKLNLMTVSLSESLGADTAELAMRVGLHSGPVTAGVLRGQKSRFQLFGDSVNMASRMESNGSKGRIHISQATADELIKAGKSHWVVTREGTIPVKGKGDQQTYWINPASLSRTKSMATSFVTSSGTNDEEQE